ncbi:restriction endonuclease subunit S [Nocardia sp. CA-129566]|uniref:restriction endonuclease subunit S n=1 Tax=Nocardia sp. CA-129566 TaxID=3239976 RepID=UPI003D96ECC2
MSDALPSGWVETPLGSVCAIVSGATPKTAVAANWNGDIAWVTPDDMSRDRSQTILQGRRSLTAAGYNSCSAQLIPVGSVIFSSRAPIGFVAIAGKELCTNQGCKTAVPPPEIDSRYLYWYLRWATPEIAARASGTTFKEISAKKFAETVLRLPPLLEQLRIVEALEDHLSRLDAAGESMSNAASLTSALEQVIHARLTAPNLFSAHGSARLGEIAAIGTGATPLRSRSEYYVGGSIPWITSGHLNQSNITRADQFITERALRETSVKLYPAGTLLMAMYGEGKTRGKTSELMFPAATNQACAAIVLHDEHKWRRPWIKFVLQTKYDELRRMAAGGVQPNLNLGKVRAIRIPLPSADVQETILGDLARWTSLIDANRSTVQVAEVRALNLRRTLLNHAFSGRLVPQDPADEPATELLARIRNLRPGRASGRRPRRPTQQELLP